MTYNWFFMALLIFQILLSYLFIMAAVWFDSVIFNLKSERVPWSFACQVHSYYANVSMQGVNLCRG